MFYNESINGYNLISDCVNGYNNNQWNIVYNISMFTKFSPIIAPPTEIALDKKEFEEEYYIIIMKKGKFLEKKMRMKTGHL